MRRFYERMLTAGADAETGASGAPPPRVVLSAWQQLRLEMLSSMISQHEAMIEAGVLDYARDVFQQQQQQQASRRHDDHPPDPAESTLEPTLFCVLRNMVQTGHPETATAIVNRVGLATILRGAQSAYGSDLTSSLFALLLLSELADSESERKTVIGTPDLAIWLAHLVKDERTRQPVAALAVARTLAALSSHHADFAHPKHIGYITNVLDSLAEDPSSSTPTNNFAFRALYNIAEHVALVEKEGERGQQLFHLTPDQHELLDAVRAEPRPRFSNYEFGVIEDATITALFTTLWSASRTTIALFLQHGTIYGPRLIKELAKNVPRATLAGSTIALLWYAPTYLGRTQNIRDQIHTDRGQLAFSSASLWTCGTIAAVLFRLAPYSFYPFVAIRVVSSQLPFPGQEVGFSKL